MPIDPSELPTVTDMGELESRLQDCPRCRLAETRTKLVFGAGNPSADIVFIGEAPGHHEDQQGIPFIGAAGKLLDEMLITALSLTRKEVYICNVNKCRPPNNRDPLPDEIAACHPYLVKQLELISPKVICTLGNFATRALLEKEVYISKVHGQLFELGAYKVFPSFHPAAALYATATKESLQADFDSLAKLLAADAGDDSAPDGPTGPPQLELF